MGTMITKRIEKEEVSNLKFPSKPIKLRTAEERKGLFKKLHDAEKLGNLFHNKIEIIFQDEEGLKSVFTTIWAVGKEHILLKKGVFIPIQRIVSLAI